MNIVLAYDGSEFAAIALANLSHAGIPDGANLLILSTAEWPSGPADFEASEITMPNLLKEREEAEQFVLSAKERVLESHGSWNVETEVLNGSPAVEIITKAREWSADLIVVGTRGQSAVERFLFGSISHQILTGADRSVRIGRKIEKEEGSPLRIMLAVDGSTHAQSAVDVALERTWPNGTEFFVVTSSEYSYQASEEDRLMEHTHAIHDEIIRRCREKGFEGRSVVNTKALHPKHAILAEAERAEIDTIFMGARGLTEFERFFLGSVSASIAIRAECTVEVVRA